MWGSDWCNIVIWGSDWCNIVMWCSDWCNIVMWCSDWCNIVLWHFDWCNSLSVASLNRDYSITRAVVLMRTQLLSFSTVELVSV